MAGCDEPFRTYAPPDWQGQQSSQLIHGDFAQSELRNFSTSAHEVGVHVKCNSLGEYYPGNDRAGRSERVYTFQRKMGCRAHRTEPEFRDMRGVGQLTEYAAGIADPSTLHFKNTHKPDNATLTMTRGARHLYQNTVGAHPSARSNRSSRSQVSVRSMGGGEPATIKAPLPEPRTFAAQERLQGAPMGGQMGERSARSERSMRSGRSALSAQSREHPARAEQRSARSAGARSGGSAISHGAPEWNFGKLPGYTTHNTEYGVFPDVTPAVAGRSITGFPHRVFQDFY